MLEEQLINSDLHDREAFDCGTPQLDSYIKTLAVQHSVKGVSKVYVLVDSDQPSTVIGFYTLSAAQLDVVELSPTAAKKMPRQPVPCFRMGRLALHRTYQGKGLGQRLLGLAVDRCISARKYIAAYALLVDAKDEAARDFYQHYGFTSCSQSPMTLYLPFGRF